MHCMHYMHYMHYMHCMHCHRIFCVCVCAYCVHHRLSMIARICAHVCVLLCVDDVALLLCAVMLLLPTSKKNKRRKIKQPAAAASYCSLLACLLGCLCYFFVFFLFDVWQQQLFAHTHTHTTWQCYHARTHVCTCMRNCL